LDRLGPAKEIAQVGATIGREFNYDLLQIVSPLNEQALQQGLRQLVEAELVYQNGVPPQARYLFKHALVQETAYQSLLKSRRQQLHQQIAYVLEERFTETVETQPELVAHHYTEAGLIAQAIPYWQRAGERAVQRSAHVEAISHLTKGLELLKTFPDTSERAQRELTLQLALGVSLIAMKGYAAQEVEKALARARELCQQVGETSQLLLVLSGLSSFHMIRGELQTALELEASLLHLDQRLQSPALLLETHLGQGAVLTWRGEFPLARKHLEKAMTFIDSHQHSAHAFLHDAFPKIVCLSYIANVLWLLGYPDQALKRSQEVLSLAQGLSHLHSLAWALSFGSSWVHQNRGEWQTARERAEAAIVLCTEQGFAHWLAIGTMLLGCALTNQGQTVEGIALLHQGLTAWRVIGAELTRPYFLALLAEAYGKVEQVEEGLTVLAEALAVVDKSGECWCEAELYRLKGELLLARKSKNQRANGKNQKSLTPST
jgi:predicted ATPase